MVSHLHTETRQIRRPSTAKQQQTHHSNPLCIPQRLWESVPNTSADSYIGSQQSNHDGLLRQQHRRFHHGNRQNISNGSKRQRTIPQSTGANSSIKSTRHLNQALTSLQLTKPRQHRETPSNALWTSTCHQRAHQNQLWVLFLACNTQSCHGSSKTALFSSTTTSSTVMEYPATSEDGSQTTRLPSANLEKAFSTCHHQSSNNIPSSRTDSTQASVLEKYISRGILQEPSEDKSNHGSTIDKLWTHQWCAMSTKSITLYSNPHFVLPSTTSAPQQTEDKGITTQEEETPAIVNQQPMKEEATSSKKQKVTITEETPAHPTTAPTSFAPSMAPAGVKSWKSNIKKDTGRQHHRRKHSKTTKDNNRTTGSAKAWGITRTTKNKRMHQWSGSSNEEWATSDNSNNRIKNRARTIGTHHQRFTRIWSGEVEESNNEGNDITGQSRSFWRDHTRPSNRRGEEEHHRFQMGSSKQRRSSQVTHRWPRIWWSHQGRRWRLCINTTLCNPQGHPAHCISKILEHQGRRHQHSIFHALRGATTSILLKPPSEFYTNKHIYILETEEGDVWSQVITKSLARPSSKHHERTGLHTAHIRAQCVQASRRKGIHHGLCRRSIFCRKNSGDQQHLQQDPRKDVTTSNWKSITGQHIVLFGKKNHQQRRSCRHQSWWWVRGQHLPRDVMQSSSNNNNRINNRKNQCWRRATARSTGASIISTTCRKTTMAGIHQARHQLRNERTCKSTSTTNHQRPEETKTSGQVSCRHKRLQIQHQTNNQAVWQDTTTTRLGRMPSDKTKAQQALSSSYLAPASTLDHERKEW